MELSSIVGFLATLVAFTLFIPQAVTTWRHRNNPVELRGVSITTQVLVLLSALLWNIYAILEHTFWVGIHESLAIPIAIFIIFLVVKARKQDKRMLQDEEDQNSE